MVTDLLLRNSEFVEQILFTETPHAESKIERERDEERGGGGGGGCGGSGGGDRGGGGKPVEAEEGAAVETDAENSTEVREGMRHAGPKAMARDQ